jgi:glycosyltransferase involved in cell wall biosynthesis
MNNLKIQAYYFDASLDIRHQHFSVVIPAFNEASNIEMVVRQASQHALTIVVDDGSSDETARIALNAGAYVVCHEVNRGYDNALQTGIRAALELGSEFVVTMDADGQHDPALLDYFRAELEGGADLVVGDRDCSQRWSETVFRKIGRIVWGINDPLCGMKGYRLALVEGIDDLNTYDSIGTELAIRLIKRGAKLHQFAVQTRPRVGESKFGIGIKVNLRIFRALLLGLFVTH